MRITTVIQIGTLVHGRRDTGRHPRMPARMFFRAFSQVPAGNP
jgi:hypothetical protein